MTKLLTSFFLACSSFILFAQTPELSAIEFASGFDKPVDIDNAGDGRLFICEQHTGKIRIIHENGSKSDFLDMGSKISTGNEQGLLGLTFHPDYANNGYFYINYTTTQGNTNVCRFEVSSNDENVANASSERLIISVNQPYGNHNGGDLFFGPDGYLYIPTGDGGSSGDPNGYAQNTNSLLGKILRLDVDAMFPYGIPSDNPYADSQGGLPEIYAVGVRNPWRNTIDADGNLWVADVGQNAVEEVNVISLSEANGANFGWKCYEGNAEYSAVSCSGSEELTYPVADWSHNDGACSITGGIRYNGEMNYNLVGTYLYSDFCASTLKGLQSDGQGAWSHLDFGAIGMNNPVGFGVDQLNEVYVAAIYAGKIYRIAESNCNEFSPFVDEDATTLKASAGLSYQWYKDGQEVDLNGTDREITPFESGDYSVEVTSIAGCTALSNVVNVTLTGLDDSVDTDNKVEIYPNPFTEKATIQFPNENLASYTLKISSMKGDIVQVIEGIKSNAYVLERGELSDGQYIVELSGEGKVLYGKFMIE